MYAPWDRPPLTVDEEDMREAALDQRSRDVAHYSNERRGAKRHCARERAMVRRHAVVDGRGEKRASGIRHASCDCLIIASST